MELSELAEGLVVTDRQRKRDVSIVDRTDEMLTERLSKYSSVLPTEPAEAATMIELYVSGNDVETIADELGQVPMIVAKTLHITGMDGISPLAPEDREPLYRWLRGGISGAEAKRQLDVNEYEFALAAFVESHDPHESIATAVEGALAPRQNASVRKRDTLADTMSDGMDLP